MRRTVAMLLVTASPLLLAHPVGATDERRPAPAVAAPVMETPADAVPPAAAPVGAVPAEVVQSAVAAAPSAGARLGPAAAPAPVRHGVKSVRAKVAPVAADVSEATYRAKLQADLCHARQIFCGLDRNGRYPGR